MHWVLTKFQAGAPATWRSTKRTVVKVFASIAGGLVKSAEAAVFSPSFPFHALHPTWHARHPMHRVRSTSTAF